MSTEPQPPYHCPGCESNEGAQAAPYNGYAMVQCRKCELLHTHERNFPTSQYEEVYAQQGAFRLMIEMAKRTAAGQAGFRELWWYKKLALRWLEEAGKGRLLDVGCGPGTFLLVAKNRGWEVSGVEPSPEPVNLAKSFGLNVVQGLVEDLPAPDRPYDAITSFEVLEHVSKPQDMLRAMHELLRPGGRLLLSVPNLDDPYCLKQMIPSAIPPVHVNFFQRRSLAAALKRAGFEVERFYTLPIPTSSLRNVYGTRGFLFRLPLLALRWLVRQVDGTTLVVMAQRA